jgi:hypothetical protein
VPSPSAGKFADAADTARRVAEAGFRRRQENLWLLQAQADRLVERDFRLFRQFAAELQPLGLISRVEFGDFAMPRDPYGMIIRPVVIHLPENHAGCGRQLVLHACYVGTGLAQYEVPPQDGGFFTLSKQPISPFGPSALETVLIDLAADLADLDARRAFNRDRPVP